MYMAMREAMSSTGPPGGDYASSRSQFYQHNISGQSGRAPPQSGSMFSADQAMNDATAAVAATGAAAGHDEYLNPEGRVSRPARRRARSSRRTPTTLLNTDTTNFRAMVQQFTGGPSAAAGTGYPSGYLNFGLATARQQIVDPTTALMAPSAAYHHHHQLQQFQQQQQPNDGQQQQQYMYSLNSGTGGNMIGGGGGGGDDVFFGGSGGLATPDRTWK